MVEKLETKLEKEICCDKPLAWQELPGNIDHNMFGVCCSDCGTIYEHRNTGLTVYQKPIRNSSYSCLHCGSGLNMVEVLHSVHDGLFNLSGSGKVQKECIPYCPNCEAQPKEQGSIITLSRK